MQIQINTDSNIAGHERLGDVVRAVVAGALSQFERDVTRVEVHLSDQRNGHKGGPRDKRCMMEARLAERQPAAVSHQAPTVQQAIHGAAHKLKRLVESTLARIHHH